ncbi:uncharacterized protein LOC141852573 [Brevipalpus obovatus]|uniref:uncharacterized protein LOC141852573 n=1 Tax=Brevipalpus obovatus TaxID=246614 RepID=UPI003D9F3B44
MDTTTVGVTATTKTIEITGAQSVATLESSSSKQEESKTSPAKITPVETKLTMKERMALRAKRFGSGDSSSSSGDGKLIVTGKANDDDVLKKRAARFGISETDNTTNSGNAVDLDKLKKRAQRFGEVVSDKVKKLDQQERLRKRQQRFT